MPISHEHKLFFIHVPKAAGTSITETLKMDDVGHHPAQYYAFKYPSQWNKWKKFTVVRNPWDRMVSNYEYAKLDKSYWHDASNETKHPDYDLLKNVSFKDCVVLLRDNKLNHKYLWRPQTVYTHFNNKPTCKVFKYEKMAKDPQFKALVPEMLEINRNNSSRDYKAYYDDESKHIIEQVYHMDIKLLKYKF